MYDFLHVKRIRTSPYHPQMDGLTERFNGTLKSMLRKFVNKTGKDWDEYIPYLLFAYREVPQGSTGFSPFELLYRRRVRGPLDVLPDTWMGQKDDEDISTPLVVEMRRRLQEMMGIAQANLKKAQDKQKKIYDRNTRNRTLNAGNKVLVLLPNPQHPLRLEWRGPYEVLLKVSDVDYEIEMNRQRKEKGVYHINMLKEWHKSSPTMMALDGNEWDQEEGGGNTEPALCFWDSQSQLNYQRLNTELPQEQQKELQQILESFPQIFDGTPGRTAGIEHVIHTEDNIPVRQKPYRIPYSQRDLVRKEIDNMMEAGIIQPSVSAWASPIILVSKKDGGIRFCVDYRKLNAKSAFDAYPMPRIEELFEKIGPARVISTLDLAKGYWQIPLDRAS